MVLHINYIGDLVRYCYVQFLYVMETLICMNIKIPIEENLINVRCFVLTIALIARRVHVLVLLQTENYNP